MQRTILQTGEAGIRAKSRLYVLIDNALNKCNYQLTLVVSIRFKVLKECLGTFCGSLVSS